MTRPILIYDAPAAVTESQYGIALGYYETCDDARCRDCVPSGYADGDYSGWSGFEGWEEPIAIFNDTESDSITHCRTCRAVIKHDLTSDGYRYVMDAVIELISEPGSHQADVVAQWWDAYGADEWGLDASDLREIIEQALVAAGVTELVPGT